MEGANIPSNMNPHIRAVPPLLALAANGRHCKQGLRSILVRQAEIDCLGRARHVAAPSTEGKCHRSCLQETDSILEGGRRM